jgi:hypothetical protein
MPRIPDFILQCTAYLYSSTDDANSGTAYDGGSGFLVSVPAQRADLPSQHIYIVTNKHVFDGGAKTVRLHTVGSHDRILDRSNSKWFVADNDDIAVNLLDDFKRSNWMFHHIPIDSFVTCSLIDQLNLGIGDEVFMVGRLLRDEEELDNSPIVRFGHISCPLIPLINIWGEEVILAEYRTLGKASGSPVFLEISQRQRDFYADQLGDCRHLLLGVNRGNTQYRSPVEMCGKQLADMKALVDSSMSMVVPAWKLKMLLERDDVSRQRQEIENSFPRPVAHSTND